MIGIWLGVLTSSLILCLFLRLTPDSAGLDARRQHWRHARTLSADQDESDPADVGLEPYRSIFARASRREVLAGRRVRVRRVSESAPRAPPRGCQRVHRAGLLCNVLDEHGAFLLAQPVHMPAGFFASNNAMIEPGRPIPGNLLLGVSTPLGPHLYRSQYNDRPDTKRVLAGNPPWRWAPPTRRARPPIRCPHSAFFWRDSCSTISVQSASSRGSRCFWPLAYSLALT